MNIRQADEDQFQNVRQFYDDVIDAVGDSADSVGWKKGIYPSQEFLKNSIQGKELFIAEEDGEIIGAMIVNHSFNEEYGKYDWPTKAEEAEITVIHALAVRPAFRKKGFAKQMVMYVIREAERADQKGIRLDVLKGNRNAKKLYAGMGFQYLHTIPMFYEDTGWADFELYEYALSGRNDENHG